MSFGDWFRNERERRGWSQSWVARRVGVTPAQMNNIEKGRSRAGTETLARLLALYETTPAEVLRQEERVVVQHTETDQPPDHIGVRELAADAALCARHRITPQEIAELAALVAFRDGQQVVLRSKDEALAALQFLRSVAG